MRGALMYKMNLTFHFQKGRNNWNEIYSIFSIQTPIEMDSTLLEILWSGNTENTK
jgi:hypothetical protein